MNDARTAAEALRKIQLILDEFAPARPVVPRAVKTNVGGGAKVSPERVLARVQGIIKGFTEANAELKLKNLLAFTSTLQR